MPIVTDNGPPTSSACGSGTSRQMIHVADAPGRLPREVEEELEEFEEGGVASEEAQELSCLFCAPPLSTFVPSSALCKSPSSLSKKDTAP